MFSAIDKGQLPPAVMDDILADVSPSDTKTEVIEKVRKGKLVSST